VSAAAEIDLADFLIGLHVLEFSLAQHRALVKHRHAAIARDLADEGHVVLDDDETVPAGEREQEFAGAVGLLVGQAAAGSSTSSTFGS